METKPELDKILASLAKSFVRQSDILLNLRKWVNDPKHAGSCIKAYFELLSHAPQSREVLAKLRSLKAWLEERLDILVVDVKRAVCLEKLPLGLEDDTDLFDFCHRKMSFVRNDRCHEAGEIRLEFSFQGNDCFAAR